MRQLEKGELKPVLYTFRVLLTGINLMRTEHAPLDGPSWDQLTADVMRLQSVLDEAEAVSQLPDRPSAEPALHDLLVRARLSH